MTFPQVELPFLPPNTIVPSPVSQEDIFIQYFNRMYEDIAFAVNQKDFTFFTIPVTSTASDIPNLPNFGAFFVSISGVDSGMPAATWALAKADAGVAGGGLVPITFQPGTVAPWIGFDLIMTSTANNYQIAHNAAATVEGNFNIRIIGTQ